MALFIVLSLFHSHSASQSTSQPVSLRAVLQTSLSVCSCTGGFFLMSIIIFFKKKNPLVFFFLHTQSHALHTRTIHVIRKGYNAVSITNGTGTLHAYARFDRMLHERQAHSILYSITYIKCTLLPLSYIHKINLIIH